MIKKIWSLYKARNLEFIRDRASLGWSFLFPFLLVIGFGFSFSDQKPVYKIGYIEFGAPATLAASKIFGLEHVTFVPFADLDAAIKKVERHQIDLLVDVRPGAAASAAGNGGTPPTGLTHKFWANSSSANGYFLEKIVAGLGDGGWEKQSVSGAEVRYVDWFFPGIVGLNMMFSALFGVGYVIVRYRKSGVLKRLRATPITAFEFLTAQILSRLSLIVFNLLVVFVGCYLILHFQVRGSLFDLAIVYLLGATCLISIGLLVAAWVTSEEFAGGVLNMLTWPMMFLSGVWFSLDGLNPFVQKAALFLPLTHIVMAARDVMIDGKGLADISQHLIILGAITVFGLVLGSLSFRWQEK